MTHIYFWPETKDEGSFLPISLSEFRVETISSKPRNRGVLIAFLAGHVRKEKNRDTFLSDFIRYALENGQINHLLVSSGWDTTDDEVFHPKFLATMPKNIPGNVQIVTFRLIPSEQQLKYIKDVIG